MNHGHLFDTSALLAHFRNESGGAAVQTLQRSTSTRLPLADALIAACAAASKAVLVHRDAHMRSIPSDLVPQLDLAI